MKKTKHIILFIIEKVLQKWEPLPTTYTKLDVRCLLQEDCIETVEMDDVSIDESNQMSNTEAKQSDDDIILPGKSKWETDTSEDRLSRSLLNYFYELC